MPSGRDHRRQEDLARNLWARAPWISVRQKIPQGRPIRGERTSRGFFNQARRLRPPSSAKAIALLKEGASPAPIDRELRALRRHARWGPLALNDEGGDRTWLSWKNHGPGRGRDRGRRRPQKFEGKAAARRSLELDGEESSSAFGPQETAKGLLRIPGRPARSALWPELTKYLSRLIPSCFTARGEGMKPCQRRTRIKEPPALCPRRSIPRAAASKPHVLTNPQ